MSDENKGRFSQLNKCLAEMSEQGAMSKRKTAALAKSSNARDKGYTF